jgi:polyhydroxybutyrate depolymerase
MARAVALGLALAVDAGACILNDKISEPGDSGANRIRDSGFGRWRFDGGGLASEDAEVGSGAPDSGEATQAGDSDDAGGEGGGSDAEDGASDAGLQDDGQDSGAHGQDADGGALGLCSGKGGSLRGKVRASVMVGGSARTFIYYAPASLDPNNPVPVVLFSHGPKTTDEDAFTQTGIKEIADREGLLAIFPSGSGDRPWNVGLNASGPGAEFNNPAADDQGFLDAILAFAEADQCLDKKHIFVSGFSMGGYFSNENGCLRSDIASLAAHSAGSHDLSSCPGTRKPVILFHGDADTVVPYRENGVLTRDRWAARNGCGTDLDSQQVVGGTCDFNRSCPDRAQVGLCHFDGMGHTWAGGVGSVNVDASRANAAELAWEFWKRYAW